MYVGCAERKTHWNNFHFTKKKKKKKTKYPGIIIVSEGNLTRLRIFCPNFTTHEDEDLSFFVNDKFGSISPNS